MDFLTIISVILLGIIAIIFLTAYICFRMTFYVREKNKIKSDVFSIPPGKEYEKIKDRMIEWQKQIKKMPHDDLSVTTHDGLVLRGKYFELDKNAPVELMMHGYKGSSFRDLCGGVNRAFAVGHNVLLFDHRAHGESDGNVITFGINESKDCLLWIDLLTEKYGKDIKVILTGVSMGAATALMAIGRGLPPCVKGVLADCGYSSTKDIIKLVIKRMHLPADILYPFVKLGAKIYGKFDLEEIVPKEAVKMAKIPVVFAHGDVDDFVPYSMSVESFNACQSTKRLITIEGAGHGLCYPHAPEKYVEQLSDFFSYLK
ncbi:MAG: alpha/beta hydrolase [Clostridia bacterium]|nr:alpha/beta hydrolase [Clostridia bacterium]